MVVVVVCECYHPRPGELSHVIQLATTIYTGGPFGVAGTRNQSFERIRRLTCNSSVSRFLFEDFLNLFITRTGAA